MNRVWREGTRIRHNTGIGYADFVPDEMIRDHLEAAIAAGDVDAASFAAATLALRNRERLTSAVPTPRR